MEAGANYRVAVLGVEEETTARVMNALLGYRLLPDKNIHGNGILIQHSRRPALQITHHQYQGLPVETYPPKGRRMHPNDLRDLLHEKLGAKGLTIGDITLSYSYEEIGIQWTRASLVNGIEFALMGNINLWTTHKEAQITYPDSDEEVDFYRLPDLTGADMVLIILNMSWGYFRSTDMLTDYIEKLQAKGFGKTNGNKPIYFVLDTYGKPSAKEAAERRSMYMQAIKPFIELPAFFEINAHYALQARQFIESEVGLEELQQDESIQFFDLDGTFIQGLNLEPVHVQRLQQVSGIALLEEALADLASDHKPKIARAASITRKAPAERPKPEPVKRQRKATPGPKPEVDMKEIVAALKKEVIATIKEERALPKQRSLKNHEIREIFLAALKEAKEEINIISPWITKKVVDADFIRMLEEALKRGVRIKILYGISDPSSRQYGKPDETVPLAASLVKKFSRYGDLFKMKYGQTHQKLLICDNRYFVDGSFNFLSFKGEFVDGTRSEGATYSEDLVLIQHKRSAYFDF